MQDGIGILHFLFLHMTKLYYAGIGSRNISPVVSQLMTDVAGVLETQGIVLRSGGAEGSDTAFEKGVVDPNNKVIYVAYKKKTIPHGVVPPLEHFEHLAEQCHNHWHNCNEWARKLLTRNMSQILGHDPQNYIPSTFVLAYTQNGQYIGGTATAMRCADMFNVPIFNFGKYDVGSSFDLQSAVTGLQQFLKPFGFKYEL